MSNIVTTLRHWITQLTERNAGEALSSIHHKLDLRLLAEAHRRLSGVKAPGVDGQTKADYSQGLEKRLEDLLNRVRSLTYRAPPVRRVEIPKPDGSTRPLGVPTYEDKVLQKAFVMLVEPVFEKEFDEGSYGYRPGRTAHDAIRAVDRAIGSGHHWIIELDIKGYFDSIPHNELREQFSHRIKDGVLNRLVLGWLKAGVLKENQWQASEEGTPQGGIISPLLANLYLHHVLDQWIRQQVKPRLQSGVELIRYADDALLCFANEEDARRVYAVLSKRFEKYGLSLHPEKTRLIDFRPPARREGESRESFSFLGFTFYWAQRRKGGWCPKVKTECKRKARKLKEIGEYCHKNRHRPIREQQAELKRKVEGHVNYYGVSHNFEALKSFERAVQWVWRKWLNRRGAPKRITCKAMDQIRSRNPWVQVRIKHSLWERPRERPHEGEQMKLQLW